MPSAKSLQVEGGQVVMEREIEGGKEIVARPTPLVVGASGRHGRMEDPEHGDCVRAYETPAGSRAGGSSTTCPDRLR